MKLRAKPWRRNWLCLDKIRFRRFRLVSIDTHLWSELTSRRIYMAERDRQGFGGLPVQLCSLHEQVDNPPETNSYKESQKENDSSTKLVASKVGSGGE